MLPGQLSSDAIRWTHSVSYASIVLVFELAYSSYTHDHG